jgi:hypothetical protein
VPNGRSTGNIKPRTGIRLAIRTIAGAHISEAAAPMKMLLRVIRLPRVIAVIEPSFVTRAGGGLLNFCLPRWQSL